MSSLVSLKTPVNGFLLVLAYTSFIICVVMIHRDKELFKTYPPAVVAQMVVGILQMCWMLGYFMFGRKRLFSARNMFIVNGLCMLYCFGSSIAMTVLGRRHGPGYCPGNVKVDKAAADCAGVLRGTMGMAWALWIWNLLWMAFTGALISSTRSSWAEPLGNVPVKEEIDEPAPKH